jgi:hypothetical protein
MDEINAAINKIYALPETDCDERFDMAKIVGELPKECVLTIVKQSFEEKEFDSLGGFDMKVEQFKRYVKYQTLGDDCWIHCYECDKPHFGTDSDHKKECRSMMIYNYEIAVKNFKNKCENWFKEISEKLGHENDAYRGDLFASMIFRMYTGTIEVL